MASLITCKQLRDQLFTASGPVLLDVRRAADFEANPQLLPTAIRRDPETFDQWKNEYTRGFPVAVYCVHGGSVSQGIANELLKAGAPTCYLEGGIEQWKTDGYDLVSA